MGDVGVVDTIEGVLEAIEGVLGATEVVLGATGGGLGAVEGELVIDESDLGADWFLGSALHCVRCNRIALASNLSSHLRQVIW